MRIYFDCDNQSTVDTLVSRANSFGSPGVIPRETTYGSEPGTVPFGEAYPDKLVDPKDYKAVIAECHAKKIFAFYHQQATWGPDGFEWNQNGLNYCWSWSGTAAVMDTEAKEGKPVKLLSPVCMGHLVRWKNKGNYLGDFIRGAQQSGICEASFTPDMHDPSPRGFLEGWEENALLHRLGEAWDADNSSKSAMIQHAISQLAAGAAGQIAYNWEGHALECVGVEWDESQPNNLVWWIRNSHKEKTIIKRVGNNAVPDEFYGFLNTVN